MCALLATVPPLTGGPPTVVHVNPAYDRGTAGWGVSSFSSLEDGLAFVADGGTVVLSEGTHRVGAPVWIHRDVTISGQGAGLTVVAFEGGEAPASGFAMAGATFAVTDLALVGTVCGIASWGGRLDITRCELSGFHFGVIALSLFVPHELSLVSSIVHQCDTALLVASRPTARALVTVDSSTLADNGWGVRSAGCAPACLSVTATILAFHEGGALAIPGGVSVLENCCLWESGDIPDGSTLGNMVADPLFAQGSYRLRADSPCIDAAGMSGPDDFTGRSRPVGARADLGAFEGGRAVLVHLSDTHLLAPDGDTLYIGVNTTPRAWDTGILFARIHEALPPSWDVTAFLVTGDIVDLATTQATYTTPVGTVTEPRWERTYVGYLAFKERLAASFPGVPVYETVGNHDYREHPLYPWVWGDMEGIDEGFYSAFSYEPIQVVTLEDDIVLVLLSSGHDVIATKAYQESVLYPYLALHADNAEEILHLLRGGEMPAGLEGYIGGLAYGSGITAAQIAGLDAAIRAHPDKQEILACHHPVVYHQMTVTRNVPSLLDLVRTSDVPFVLSGHIHQPSLLEVSWDTGHTTAFAIGGAAPSSSFGLLCLPLGNAEPCDTPYRSYS